MLGDCVSTPYDWVDRKQKTWEQITNGSNTPDTMRVVSYDQYNEIGPAVRSLQRTAAELAVRSVQRTAAACCA